MTHLRLVMANIMRSDSGNISVAFALFGGVPINRVQYIYKAF